MKLLDFTGIDGAFGPMTQGAIGSFQSGEGLTPDGIVGSLTWGALPSDPDTPQLSFGSHRPEVSSLQQALLDYRGANTPTDPGPIDSDFGPRTQAAVRAYQQQAGIAVDGIVGDKTWWVPAGAAGATLASLARLTTV
jgi:peptidoglycan hydrolase-like protein with peptidoglycan-binding domain